VRELGRKLPDTIKKSYEQEFERYQKVLTQERHSKDKIYSLHEPQTACIAKGKAHTPYEFGAKTAVVRGRETGVVTAVKRFAGNPHDSKTLQKSLDQSERVRKNIGGTRPEKAATDRGFRGMKKVGSTQIFIPANTKEPTKYKQQVARKRFRARAAIEPTIAHLKRNHSLGLNFLKGVVGDIHNALLAGIGYNLKLRYNQINEQIVCYILLLIQFITQKLKITFAESQKFAF
jgi:transposase, IS5 family